GVVVTGPEHPINTGEFHVLRAVDVLGQVPSRFLWDHRVVSTMQHEGGYTKPAETIPDVPQVAGSNRSSRDRRARTEALPSRQPLTQSVVALPARRNHIEFEPGAPRLGHQLGELIQKVDRHPPGTIVVLQATGEAAEQD